MAENEALAAAAAGFDGKAPEQERAEPTKGTAEAAGDPVAQLAAELAKSGITPEQARQNVQFLTYVQTPEGQREYLTKWLATDQGQAVRQEFGRRELADLLATPGGAERLVRMAKQFGANVPDPEPPEEQTEEQKLRNEILSVKAELAAIKEGTTRTAKALDESRTDTQRRDEYIGWAANKPQMNADAHARLSNRARELCMLYPDRYSGAGGFARAAEAAYADYSGASFLAPPKRPKTVPTTAAVSGLETSNVDFAKMSDRDFDSHLKKQFSLVGDDFAKLMTGQAEE